MANCRVHDPRRLRKKVVKFNLMSEARIHRGSFYAITMSARISHLINRVVRRKIFFMDRAWRGSRRTYKLSALYIMESIYFALLGRGGEEANRTYIGAGGCGRIDWERIYAITSAHAIARE